MNSTASPRKKSPSSKTRPKKTGAATARRTRVPRTVAATAAASYRRAFGSWRASLPGGLERDTLLMPDAIAESVVQEVEAFLGTTLAEDFADRLAAKAHRLYPRHRHFHKMLNRPGNAGRDNLYAYMRHWTAGWLKRERSALYKKLPWEFGQGRRLPQPAGEVAGAQQMPLSKDS